MGNDLSPMTGALRRPLLSPSQASSADWLRHRPYRSLYVPEITLRLRKGVDRETSAVTITGGAVSTVAFAHILG